ncbi:NAD(P)H-quinone oxidoreductase [Rhodococcus erythropolis]|jgi:NADPH2:quinone reductase|uniref:Putative oxidoreductase n=1 Tax=Rhodococcus erythropolis (strain PR4 / NBRC 100887) TaxID=234621 RepID=C0ZLZ4_RHOE4|nr:MULTISPECIES: NAD(P)H-quinone oxidoreductase [Rhodococcus]MCD2155171.1 NAD(P)H-quinone oxidoreductase [Rhodococcus cerastii]MCW0194570.1 NAD(P)H-quinone oxidoreductase [Rhodococcus sp. (in: high G+C Gram-positive bacteria)]ALU67960.1 NAD(P)H-quinone oxidoreductase [Rhodococcus erythropolis R138]EQM33104.1 NAD(P)H quinone oxidoreductase [Rhodococcus erythropolis DN1]MBS2991725.1 NAD(P)H-quinone oxidoreductase [Rhodococcus erythropolis]
MYAITIDQPGGPEVMKWAQQPDPELPRGHVLVEVAATAVNRADLLQRQGFYPPPPGASDILGLECSGVIVELGEDVTGWSVGDEVCALLAGGGYAEKVAVPATQLLPVPAGVDLRVAASLPEVACTVWSNVVMRGGLRRGQVLLVHGGGGGIGTHAIQVGKALGARVAVTAGSEDKLNRCRELGADILINYRDSDFVASLAEATDNHGADVVLDNMGASYLGRNVDALAMDGHVVIIGMQGGRKGEVDIAKLMGKRGNITSTGLRGRPLTGPGGKADIVADVRAKLWPLIADGSVQPIVSTELPITEAPLAHQLLDSPETVGKVILTVK